MRTRPRIQTEAPADLPAVELLHLPVTAVRPLVRIAHRLVGPIRITERIIFDHELVLLLRGSGQLRLRDRSVALHPHTLLALPPWLPHTFDCPGVCEHIAVHFDLAPETPGAALDTRPPYRVQLEPDLMLPLERMLDPADGIAPGLVDLVRDWEEQTPTGQLRAQARLTVIIGQLARTLDRSTRGDARDLHAEAIARVLALMEARFAEPLTLLDLARTSGWSSTRFAHRFRERTGSAPMEHLRRLRIAHARRLLADPTLSIRTIAERCGFADPYHFSRVFRAIDGLAPSHYRAALFATQPTAPP